MFAGSVHALSS